VRNGSRHDPPPDRHPLPTCIQGLAALPDGYEATIRAGLPAALGNDSAIAGLPAEAMPAMAGHVRLLLAWNEAINLTGIRAPEEIAREHVLDSLAAVPLLRRAGIDDFVDLGSGGGYPGLPLAVAIPARRALLVDSIGKKARFLETAVAALGLGDRVTVRAVRAETLAAEAGNRGRWGAVVARAVADLSDLAELALPLLRTGGLLVAWKRRPIDGELADADRPLRAVRGRVAAVEAVTVPGLEDHVLVVVEKVAATPPGFPRDPAARRRQRL
jgi:16S rRNA (guanine527-N7)-methyltransferase